MDKEYVFIKDSYTAKEVEDIVKKAIAEKENEIEQIAIKLAAYETFFGKCETRYDKSKAGKGKNE